MNALTNAGELLKVRGGQPMADSRDVAQRFEKQHKHLLDSIKKLSAETSCFQDGPDFRPTYYTDSLNREQLCYLMDRDAFSLLVMGFTGQKALRWKIKYIAAFNEMEARLREDRRADALQEAERELLNIYRRHIKLQDRHKKRGTKLTVEEKKAIWKMSTEGYSHHYIAKVLGRDASNIRRWQKLVLEYAEARHEEKELCK